MTVCRLFVAAAGLAMLLVGGACRDCENAPLSAETDDPLFVQAKQLEKQTRRPEALALFLKLIDRRGERAAPESHLEAGLIYLNYTKDPVEAYHHFRKYLDLKPNSKEAPSVQGMVEAARREFARTLPARPLEDQSVRLEIAEEVSKLRRENEELRAELAARRGVAPITRSPILSVPDLSNQRAVTPPVARVLDSPLSPAPTTARKTAPTGGTLSSPMQARPMTGSVAAPGRAAGSAASSAKKAAGRTHTVGSGDTFYKLSKQYGVKMEELAAANGMSVNSPLKLGTVLKIP